MWDQFNKQNLVYRFKGPLWQLAKTLALEFCVFRSRWQLLLCQADFTVCTLLPAAIFLPLCSMHAWQHFHAGLAQLVTLPLPYPCSEAMLAQLLRDGNLVYRFMGPLWQPTCTPACGLSWGCRYHLKLNWTVLVFIWNQHAQLKSMPDFHSTAIIWVFTNSYGIEWMGCFIFVNIWVFKSFITLTVSQ